MATAGELTWSVVLAGGEGERTRPFIERWLGRHKPKQYCTFSGERSLFQSTVDRADALSSQEHRVMVVAERHLEEASAQLQGRGRGILVPQPANRGTAAGLLLALVRIQARDPEAVVVVYPSDHFVHPDATFNATVARATRAVRDRPERLVLLGVVPEGPESDYGWIVPGARLRGSGPNLHEVAAFAEKPPQDECRRLMARGGLWNSMVIAGKLATFWDAAGRTVPQPVYLLSQYADFVDGPRESEVLRRIYKRMASFDFSKDVLSRVPEILTVLALEGVVWSDWGRPERIVETLESVGAEPAFPVEQVALTTT